MKKNLILMLLTVFAFNLTLLAQDPTLRQGMKADRQWKAPSAKDRAERLAKQLSLTDEQKAKVQALYEKQEAEWQKKMADRKADLQIDREKLTADFQKQKKTQDEELAKIIGSEKFKQYDAMRAKRMEKVQERMKDTPNNPKPTE